MTDASAPAGLNIRVPDWVKDPVVKVNGKTVDGVAAGNYIAVTVNSGDRIEITYPSELTWVEGDNSNAGLWAMKSLMVYAIAAAFMSEEESQEAYGSDIAIVSATSVLKPEADQPVQTEEKVDFQDERILGAGYRVVMTTSRGEQEVTIVPYANIGQWYRVGEERPADYNSAARYPYAIWISAIMSDYPGEHRKSSPYRLCIMILIQ